MKKCLSILLVMLLSFSSLAFAKEDVMIGLGIADKKAEEGEYITREEFAVMLSNIAGITEDETSSFSDTGKSTHNSAINSVVAQNLMFPYEDGTFRPNLELTFKSAVRAVVCLVGYGPIVSREGDVDANFLIQANALSLLKGIKRDGDYITKSQAYTLLYNTLSQEVLTYMPSGSGLTPFKTGKSVLSYYRKLERINAVIQAVGDTAMSGVTAPGGHKAVSGGEVMEISDKLDLNNYFGYKCEIYYDISGGDKKIVYVTADMEKQLMAKLYPSDNITYREADRKIVYQPDEMEKERTVSLDIGTDIFVNGSLISDEPLTEVFDLESGNLCVIDYNSDNRADLVIIQKMDTYVVNSVNSNDKKITVKVWPNHDSAWKTEMIDLSDIDELTVTDMQGYARNLSEIKEWDVISVMLNRKLGKAAVYCAFENIMGTIEGISTGKDDYVKVSGKEYPIAKGYYGAYGQGADFELGASVTLKLDTDGQVFCQIKNLTGSSTLGYIIGYFQEESMLAGAVRLKILCEDGIVREFSAEEATINGQKYKDSNKIKESLDKSFESLNTATGVSIAKLVQFESTADGKIRKIDTPVIGGDDKLRPFPIKGKYGYSKSMKRGDTLEGIYRISESSKLFVLPIGGEAEIAAADASKFSVKRTLDSLKDSLESTVQCFKLGSGKYTVDIIVTQQGGEASLNADSFMHLIKSVSTAVNEKGDIVNCANVITVDTYGNKKENKYFSADETILEGYESGDVAQFVLDENNIITFAAPVFYVTEPGTNKRFVLKKKMGDDGQWTNYSEASKVLFAGIYAKEDTSLIVNKGRKIYLSGGVVEPISMESFAEAEALGSNTFFENMFIYDTKTVTSIMMYDTQGKQQFVSATDGDIVDYQSDSVNYSKALIYSWWGGCRFIILYK